MVRRDRMEELRQDGPVRLRASSLDQTQPQVDMPEQATFGRRPERGTAAELGYAPDVVEQRGGQQQIVAQPRVKLRRLAA